MQPMTDRGLVQAPDVEGGSQSLNLLPWSCVAVSVGHIAALPKSYD